jgi:hypothetical protein
MRTSSEQTDLTSATFAAIPIGIRRQKEWDNSRHRKMPPNVQNNWAIRSCSGKRAKCFEKRCAIMFIPPAVREHTYQNVEQHSTEKKKKRERKKYKRSYSKGEDKRSHPETSTSLTPTACRALARVAPHTYVVPLITVWNTHLRKAARTRVPLHPGVQSARH